MEPRSVLITGCSTGIGRATALRLDRSGWNVFAGVRKEEDARALREEGSARLQSVTIDVTNEDSIASAAALIGEKTGGRIEGLVNNAGVSVQGPLEYLPLDDLRWQFEVNVTGQVAVTQALLPQLRAGTGRVVFVGSVAGRAPTLPFIGPYGASKKAVQGIVEALRHELRPWNILVSVVEPGSVATEIWDKGDATFDGMIAALPPEGRDRYERTLGRARKLGRVVGGRGIPADKVAKKIEHALSASRPRFRYLIGADAFAQTYIAGNSPIGVRERAIGKVLGYGKRR